MQARAIAREVLCMKSSKVVLEVLPWGAVRATGLATVSLSMALYASMRGSVRVTMISCRRSSSPGGRERWCRR